MSDSRTLDFYDGSASEYAKSFGAGMADKDLRAFMDAVAPGGLVLDFGCGPGRSAALMKEAGFSVELSDASQGMADLAKAQYDLDVRVEPFGALSAVERYDGVWANFSLLHAERADFPAHLAAVRKSLKANGVFHLGLKSGEGEERDKLGRFYTYYEEGELRELLASAGFTVTSLRHGSGKGMAGTDDPFMIVLAHA